MNMKISSKISSKNLNIIKYLLDKSNFNTDCIGTLSLFSVLDLTN